ncbi:MAG: adenylate/guanylate cyclase domain-containing protein [Thermodesulfobacteriota bacterium]
MIQEGEQKHSQERTLPLRLRLDLCSAIIVLFLAAVLCLAGLLTWFNYTRNAAAALEMAGAVMSQVAEKVELKTRLLVQPLRMLADHAHILPGAGAAAGEDFSQPLLPLFLDVMSENPQVYSLYTGYANGDFFQVISLVTRPEVAPLLGAPADTRFALRRISHEGRSRTEAWRYLDHAGRPLGTSDGKPAQYDPRTRPWYKAALEKDGPVMTDLYVFTSTRDLGLTLANRVSGHMAGVFGADMTLDSLSRFLRAERIGASGFAFLFDADGRLLAYPDPKKVAKTVAGPEGKDALERSTVEDLGDPAALAVYRAFVENGRGSLAQRRLDVDGTPYIVQVRAQSELGSGRTYLALAARVDEFTGPMVRTRDQSLLFAAGLLALGIPLMALAVGRVSKSLRLLAAEADRIRNLDLDSTEMVHSRIEEVARLGDAVAGMRAALNSFSRYLPRSLVQQFVSSGKDPVLGGERREITLLFTDVENFTPISENLAPEDLMTCMSEYFQAVGASILETGGTIDKFIGDAIMAFWNAPIESEDHVELACAAALRLSRASEGLNCCRLDAGKPVLRTRVGLHMGHAVVGNVGATDRMNYTALGSTVNLASRLEGMNKFYATRILVSREVRERARKNFLFRSVDVVVPKGAREPLAIYELVGAMPQSPYPDLAAPRPMLGFCSRWERAITLYRTVQWEKALAEFTAMREAAPEDTLASMYCQRTRRLLENKPGKDWKAIQRFKFK